MDTIPLLPQDSLEQQVARLQALLEAARHVHSTIQVKEVMLETARIIVRELEMSGALFLMPGSTEPIVSYGDAPAAPYEGCGRFPLYSRESSQLLAELIVSVPDSGEYSLYEQDFIEGLVLQTAVALENATLHERDLEWARVQQDLDAARLLQRSLLPRAMPEIPGFSIAARSTTCYEVGGDYLDTMAQPDGTHLMVVADVAGKGLASAIVATAFRAALRSQSAHNPSLEEAAARLSQQHWSEGGEARRRYMTALFLRLDPAKHEIEIVNAGHNPAALLLPDGALQMIEASGPPLGMLPGMTYTAERFAFPPGARMLLYTDGLTEVFHGEEEFGQDRLVETFRAANLPEAERILDVLWETLGTFSFHEPQTDDMTALAIVHLTPKSLRAGDQTRMKNGSSVHVRLPSELGFEKVAMSTAASMAALMGFSEDRIEDLKTAVAEACINAIEHGNQLNSSLSVGVVLSTSDDQLEVRVIDDGTGVRQAPHAPDIDRKMHGEEDPRGMGMFLIQALVDEAEWHQGPPGKSFVRLVIRLDKENQ
ncbi:MAG TPA: SpoIIE family protein phosphatase [Acidobacteriaceae bacterium]|nr:SpoIIE family protein phosphatase [Acidobacteriaceae bacterium]